MGKLLLFTTIFSSAVFVFFSCEKNPTGSTSNVPGVTTDEVSEIMQTTAQCGGTVTSDGGATVTACGVCWSTNQTPTVADNKTNDGAGTSTFTSNITGLTPGTTYYVRAYATNSVGTGYGSAKSFTTEEIQTGTVTDIDGNTYKTVKIGDQWWMAENLKVTHYRNGDAIPHVTDATDWSNLTTGAYCNYDNDENNATTYGRLYNWYAIDNIRNIAPEGWHVPSDAEWQTLVDYLGGSSVAGGKMKETGTTHWNSPNTGATNESGFSALAGGSRTHSGSYASSMGNHACFWSSTKYDCLSMLYRHLDCASSRIGSYTSNKESGFSVRCLRD